MGSKDTAEMRERIPAATKQDNTVAMPQLVQMSWLEKKLKPKRINARYPVKGAPLLYASCAFGSLGDALFGFNSGKTNELDTNMDLDTDVDRFHVWPTGQSNLRGSVLQGLWWC